MRIAIVGTGYVGLVAGACFADSGNFVFCADKDPQKIESLRRGIIPIFEPGLETLVVRGIENHRLQFTTSLVEAVQGAEIVFLAVGTPALPNGEADLSFLKAAAEEVGRSLSGPCLIVNKSTVPIGCHEWTAEWVGKHAKHAFEVVSNPEFLKEGSAVDDFLRPDRVVIGATQESAFIKMKDLYSPFLRQGNPILWMDPISAEITKYACNSFLATRISFMNELAVLCDQVGGDIEEVRHGMTTDARIGRHFLYAGVGYGGSCFPKDVQALMHTSIQQNISMGIVAATEAANDRQKKYLPGRVREYFGHDLKGKTFGVWGLSFKPNTDDMREAPSLVIIEELLAQGACVRAFDPVAMKNAREFLGDRVTYCPDAYDAIQGCDALLIVTEWNEFRHPDFDQIKKRLKKPVIFDGRNLFDPEPMSAKGFTYFGVGRGRSKEK